ncbi:MAG: S6e family ribosomal protein [Candidatus Woesearchaeota archaeon]
MAIKIVIGTKDGKTHQKELSEEQTASLQGKKIGETVTGSDVGFEGYEFIITGGSDNSGTPMRRDVDGTRKVRILAVEGVGIKKKRHGNKQRKTVSGNTISEKTSQVNIKVTKEGKDPLVPPAEAENTEEKKE